MESPSQIINKYFKSRKGSMWKTLLKWIYQVDSTVYRIQFLSFLFVLLTQLLLWKTFPNLKYVRTIIKNQFYCIVDLCRERLQIFLYNLI